MNNTASIPLSNETPPPNTIGNAVKNAVIGAVGGFGVVKAGGWLLGRSISGLGTGVNYVGNGVSYIGTSLNGLGSLVGKTTTYGMASTVALSVPVRELLSYATNKIAGQPDPQSLKGKMIMVATGTTAYQIASFLQPALANYLFPPIMSSKTGLSTLPVDSFSTMCPALTEQQTLMMWLTMTFMLPQLFVIAHHKLQAFKDREEAEELNTNLKNIFSKLQNLALVKDPESQLPVLLLIIKELGELKNKFAAFKNKPDLKEKNSEIEAVIGKIEESLQAVTNKLQMEQSEKAMQELKELTLSIARLDNEDTAQVREALYKNASERAKNLKEQLAGVQGAPEKVEKLQRELAATTLKLASLKNSK